MLGKVFSLQIVYFNSVFLMKSHMLTKAVLIWSNTKKKRNIIAIPNIGFLFFCENVFLWCSTEFSSFITPLLHYSCMQCQKLSSTTVSEIEYKSAH